VAKKPETAGAVPPSQSLEALVADKVREFVRRMANAGQTGLYHLLLAEFERPLIRITLEETRGNQVAAARLLGINRNTLRKKIGELGIAVPRRRGRPPRIEKTEAPPPLKYREA
jgi:two-component system, NtrC family, nitrogen regulation response regulator GlnG